MSIRSKIILLFTALTAVITILFSIFIYLFTSKSIDENFYQRMAVRAGIAARAKYEASDHNVSFYNEIRENHLQRLPEEKEYFFETVPSERTADSINIQVPEGFHTALARNNTIHFKNKDTYYVATVYKHAQERHFILVSAVNKQGEELLSNLRRNLFSGFITAVGLVAIISLIIAKELINPIRHIISNARKITASNLHLRLQSKKGKDEIADLTQTFNDMLDRLETSFETQNNFLNKAAHELRTPLTAIIGEAELALSKPRSSGEYSMALQIIAREAEQLEHHTSSLLELAQAGYNSKETFMSELRLDELLFSVKRLIDFTEPGNDMQIDLSHLPETGDSLTINGNENLLKLALANIVQNACKYSGYKKVNVALHASRTHGTITVTDQGIGIPEKELKYIFDPFFRASNTDAFKGYGVGLPLAQKIIRLHRGELSYRSKENAGTTVNISFPSTNR